jgi:hypothetical protein
VCSGDAEVEAETSVQVEVGAGGSAGGVDEGGRLAPATGWRAGGGPRARCSGAASGRVAPVKMDVGSWDMEMWNRRGEVRAKKRTVVYIGREWDSSAMTLGNEGEGGEGEAAVAAAAQLAVWHGTGRSRQDSEWHVLPWRRFERDSAWSAHYK